MSTSYLSRLSRSVLNTLKQARDPFEGVGLRGVTLFDFAEESSVGNWRVGSDYPFGGYSKGDVRWVSPDLGHDLDPRDRQDEGPAKDERQEARAQEAFMRFSGIYSKRIDPTRAHPKMKKAGFVSVTGRPLDSLDAHIDLESYNALRYTIRVHKNSVHRTFLANLRSDNWVTGGQNEDVWQVVLHDGQKDGDWDGWKEVEVPLEAYMLTWRGKPVAEAVEMGKSKVIGVGIGLLGGDEHVEEEGEFCIDLRRIDGIVI